MKTIYTFAAILMMLLGTVSAKAQDNSEHFSFRMGFIGGSIIADGNESPFYCGNEYIGTIKEIVDGTKQVNGNMPWTIINKDYRTNFYFFSKDNVRIEDLCNLYSDNITKSMTLVDDNANSEDGNFHANIQVLDANKYHEVSVFSLSNYIEGDDGKPHFCCTAMYDLRYCDQFVIMEFIQTSENNISVDSLYNSTLFSTTNAGFDNSLCLTPEQMNSRGDGYEMYPLILNGLISKSAGTMQQKFQSMTGFIDTIADDYRTKLDRFPQSYTHTNCNHRIKFGVFRTE